MNYKYSMIFLAGFLSCALLFYVFSYSNVEIPFATGLVSFSASAPSDWVSEEDIIVFDDMIVLRIANATLSSYAATGSMKPLLDYGANGIRVVPESSEDVSIGDIVSFRFDGKLVVHRVADKGFDSEGVYFITQGDNNIFSDDRVRFEDIEYVTVGVIW
jgi:signal peptidase I